MKRGSFNKVIPWLELAKLEVEGDEQRRKRVVAGCFERDASTAPALLGLSCFFTTVLRCSSLSERGEEVRNGPQHTCNGEERAREGGPNREEQTLGRKMEMRRRGARLGLLLLGFVHRCCTLVEKRKEEVEAKQNAAQELT